MISIQEVKCALDSKIALFESTFSPTEFKECFAINHVKFKRCRECILALYVPHWVKTNQNRNNIADVRFAKFRAEKVWCICIYNISMKTFLNSHLHVAYKMELTWYYTINHWIYPSGYTKLDDVVCGEGIHFFNHIIGAYFYDKVLDLHSMQFLDNGSIYSISFHGVQMVLFSDKRSVLPHLQTYLGVVELVLC